ncbi:glycerol-3-phosphate dehydrogenase [Salinisphaera sp. USBA-960]|nr:glycerol-3-phosphate dehydrogenase [Salifodinibacter halophilus]NNC26855.1 glycerol-3-phosphate dehydrogenase [Salifodinibacter halophilus]
MSSKQHFDLVVIGGGINGSGIARDAAGRGLNVLLCEQGDLAGQTSSASTKLIHGGLRYLENYEFRLVREALKERERLLAMAPHIIWPLRFVLPHSRSQRPVWMIRAGLFLYDHLAKREKLPASGALNLSTHPAGVSLNAGFKRGFIYSDCWVQDARLVALNAQDAAERGATVVTRTRCTRAQADKDHWVVDLESDDRAASVTATGVVNASGPWVASLFNDVIERPTNNGVRLVKGSHIVVPRLFEHDDAYIFQQDDGRIVFAIPYEQDFTLVGTTDVEYDQAPGDPKASTEEIDYLCRAANGYFERQICPDDVVWTYSGVRPLYDDHSGNASTTTRDYVLDLDAGHDRPPLLSVFGGKLTTYRRLSEHALEELTPHIGQTGSAWSSDQSLPGGDIPRGDFSRYLAAQKKRYSALPASLVWRLARNYGTRMDRILGDAQRVDDLGRCFGSDLYKAEVDYLVTAEWARTSDDILWRRGKLGLRLSDAQIQAVDDYLAGHRIARLDALAAVGLGESRTGLSA